MTAPAKPCVVLQHIATEGPERLAPLFRQAGFDVAVIRVYRGVAVPRALPDDVPLIAMGGPMGVGDIGDSAHPYLAAEADLLRAQLARGAPVLGICLGAQLLAHAAGARVYPNVRRGLAGAPDERVYEVGWGPVDFMHATRDPVLAGLPARAVMLHWHGDTFDLPAGAVHLASTEACPHQAFRVGRRAFGVQFHAEVEAASVEAWLQSDAAYVHQARGPEGPARIRQDTRRYAGGADEAARERLLMNLIGRLTDG